METRIARAWMFLQLQFALIGRLDGAGLPPSVVSSQVGSNTVLPCTWTSRLRSGSFSLLHVQWSLESVGTVLEQRGGQRWTSPDYSDRAEVQESGLWSGDCSLVIKDVQVTDGGQYDGYMILDQDKTMTGVFISSVKLLVFDHSSAQHKRSGEDLVLDLHTPRSMSLVFEGSNSSKWVSLWQRDVLSSPRLQKDPLKEQLTLKALTHSDEGVYKVLDVNGLTVSFTHLTVDQHESSAQKSEFEQYRILTGDAVRHASAALVRILFSFHVLFLLFL